MFLNCLGTINTLHWSRVAKMVSYDYLLKPTVLPVGKEARLTCSCHLHYTNQYSGVLSKIGDKFDWLDGVLHRIGNISAM